MALTLPPGFNAAHLALPLPPAVAAAVMLSLGAAPAVAARQGATSPSVPTTRTVVVQAGDTLYGLARRHLGAGSRWPELWQGIKGRVASPKQLPVGLVLRLPEVAKAISKIVIGDQDQKALAACSRGGLKLEVTEAQLKANKLPILLVYGSKEGDGDEAIPKAFNRVAKLMGAKVQVIEGGDHVGTLARPELAESIVTFLREHKK